MDIQLSELYELYAFASRKPPFSYFFLAKLLCANIAFSLGKATLPHLPCSTFAKVTTQMVF